MMNFHTSLMIPSRFTEGGQDKEVGEMRGVLYPAIVGTELIYGEESYIVVAVRDEVLLRNTYRTLELALINKKVY